MLWSSGRCLTNIMSLHTVQLLSCAFMTLQGKVDESVRPQFNKCALDFKQDILCRAAFSF